MNIKHLSAIVISSLSTSLTIAQSHNCGTDSYNDHLKKVDPSLVQQEIDWNNKAKGFKILERRASKYVIPVVFHVVHVNGEGNISREQILDQMRVINEDCSFTNASKNNIRTLFLGDTANLDIEFRLAKIDPSGNCTNGINRVYSTFTNEVSQSSEEVKGLSGVQWDYRKYLNIYVVNSIASSSGTGTVLGYATFPFTTSAARDGIVVRHDRVGTIGTAVNTDNGGRTLTHELGHWLGLYHTFQGGCNNAFGDGCNDTPPVGSTFTNANCPENGNSCSTDNPDRIDMWENYMDYSTDRCMALFTTNQKTRVYSQLNGFPRSSLHTQNNLIATGVAVGTGTPQAFFSSSKRVVCAGSSVSFYDNSCKASVDSRVWTFEGGNLAGTTLENPTVSYSTPGEYEVTFKATNSSGNTTLNEKKYITVLPAIGQTPNYIESFENTTGSGFLIKPIFSTGVQWKENKSVGYKSSQSYQAAVSSATPMGSVFSIKLPAINLKELQGQQPRLSFYVAYAPHSSGSLTEILRVLVSTDCGNSYDQFIQRNGLGLAYRFAPDTDNFSPADDDQWRLLNFSLTNYDKIESAIFRIDVEANQGNSVFIDDINISRFVTGLTDYKTIALSVYPNPASGVVSIGFENPVQLKSLTVRDIMGRVIDSKTLNENTSTFEYVNNKKLIGLYYISITTENGIGTSSIIFE